MTYAVSRRPELLIPTRRVNPFPDNATRYAEFLSETSAGSETIRPAERKMADIDEANLLTSEYIGEDRRRVENIPLHRPVLDIDFPAVLLPSSTTGHYHLYLDTVMSWERYSTLLRALAAAGVVESGYAHASIDRGYSAVRLPWVRK